MFGKNKTMSAPAVPRPTPSPVLGKKGMQPSVIAADLNVLGNVISDGVLDISGKVEGNVRCHTASIRADGRIRGDVVAEIVHVYGTIEGIVKAKSVHLYNTAHVVGTIMHESLSIEDGAFVDGKFKRTDKIFVDEDGEEVQMAAPTGHLEDQFHTNDNDLFAPNDAEVKILENLRLVR